MISHHDLSSLRQLALGAALLALVLTSSAQERQSNRGDDASNDVAEAAPIPAPRRNKPSGPRPPHRKRTSQN
ncbi:MAG: hypothetical protein AAF191_05815, partial [Verrucomicrobiota bacterium]